jgi:hypothetical protein
MMAQLNRFVKSDWVYCAEIGYMFLAVGASVTSYGTPFATVALHGGIFHLFSDAVISAYYSGRWRYLLCHKNDRWMTWWSCEDDEVPRCFCH